MQQYTPKQFQSFLRKNLQNAGDSQLRSGVEKVTKEVMGHDFHKNISKEKAEKHFNEISKRLKGTTHETRSTGGTVKERLTRFTKENADTGKIDKWEQKKIDAVEAMKKEKIKNLNLRKRKEEDEASGENEGSALQGSAQGSISSGSHQTSSTAGSGSKTAASVFDTETGSKTVASIADVQKKKEQDKGPHGQKSSDAEVESAKRAAENLPDIDI